MQRYLSTFTRHLWLFLIPLLGLTLVGAASIRPTPDYTVSATLWASANLPLDAQNNSIGNPGASPADNQSALLTEMLGTRSYLRQLSDALQQAGFSLTTTQRDALEEHIFKNFTATSLGNDAVTLQYSDIDRTISLTVMQLVIRSFQDTLNGQVRTQGQSTLDLYTGSVQTAKTALDKADADVQTYLETHPGTVNLSQMAGTPPLVGGDNAPNIDTTDVRYAALVAIDTAAQTRYTTLNDHLEKLQVSYSAYLSGGESIVQLRDAPYIASSFAPSFIGSIFLGGALGLVLGLLVTTLAVLVAAWTDGVLLETGHARHALLHANIIALTDVAPAPLRSTNTLAWLRHRMGLDRRIAFLALVCIGAVIGLSRFPTTPEISISIAVVALIAALVCRWPIIGYFLSLSIVLVCELFSNPDGISDHTYLLLTNLHTFTTIPVSATPLEVLIALTVGAALVHAARRGQRFWDRGLTAAAMAVFVAFLAFGYIYGVYLTHGDGKTAQWEIRALIYLPIFYFLTVHFFKHDIRAWRAFNRILPAGLTVLCAITIERVFVLPDSQRGLYAESINGFNHETAILFVILLVWCVAKLILGGTGGEKIAAVVLAPPAIICIILSNRRAAFAVLAACILIMLLLLWVRRRRTAIVLIVILALIVPPYIVLFSKDSGPLGLAARAFTSASAAPGSRDYNSDLYRVVEKTNVRLTIRNHPLTGVGFGQPFTAFINSINLDGFTFQYYTPHIQILWVWLKLGAGGWAVFWFIFCTSLFKLGQIARYTPLGSRLTICTTAGCIIAGILVYAYFDVGLNNPRLLTLLGIAVGLLELAYRNIRRPERLAPSVIHERTAALVTLR